MKRKTKKPAPVTVPLPVEKFAQDYRDLQYQLELCGNRIYNLVNLLPFGSTAINAFGAIDNEIRASRCRMAVAQFKMCECGEPDCSVNRVNSTLDRARDALAHEQWLDTEFRRVLEGREVARARIVALEAQIGRVREAATGYLNTKDRFSTTKQGGTAWYTLVREHDEFEAALRAALAADAGPAKKE